MSAHSDHECVYIYIYIYILLLLLMIIIIIVILLLIIINGASAQSRAQVCRPHHPPSYIIQHNIVYY